MSQRAIERTLGKLATDEEFRVRFFENPAAATWEACIPLSPVELEVLSGLSRAAIARFSESLDGRILRLCLDSAHNAASRAISDPTPDRAAGVRLRSIRGRRTGAV